MGTKAQKLRAQNERKLSATERKVSTYVLNLRSLCAQFVLLTKKIKVAGSGEPGQVAG